MIRFPPLVCSHPVIFLRGNGHRPDQSHFLRPHWFWRARSIVRTPPPKKSHDTLSPPISCFPIIKCIFSLCDTLRHIATLYDASRHFVTIIGLCSVCLKLVISIIKCHNLLSNCAALSYSICHFATLCDLRWAKSRDSHRRLASESYRCDLTR